jgi:hypothetical protein
LAWRSEICRNCKRYCPYAMASIQSSSDALQRSNRRGGVLRQRRGAPAVLWPVLSTRSHRALRALSE